MAQPLSLDDLRKQNLGSLQTESALKKHSKQEAIKEAMNRKKMEKERAEAPPPAPEERKRNSDHLNTQQTKIIADALDKGHAKSEQGKQREKERLSQITKYENYHRCLPQARLPPHVRGSAGWDIKEARFHYDQVRRHLDGQQSIDMPKQLYFEAVQLLEDFMMQNNNPLDLEPGFAKALENNREAIEPALSEMAVEILDWMPRSPWYIRLTIATGHFVASYSKECKKQRLESELFTKVDKDILDKIN